MINFITDFNSVNFFDWSLIKLSNRNGWNINIFLLFFLASLCFTVFDEIFFIFGTTVHVIFQLNLIWYNSCTN